MVSNREESEEVARLERLNQELRSSLRRCRTMLHDYEAMLAANSNEAQGPEEGDEKQEA